MPALGMPSPEVLRTMNESLGQHRMQRYESLSDQFTWKVTSPFSKKLTI
jgi:hypothetical protein